MSSKVWERLQWAWDVTGQTLTQIESADPAMRSAAVKVFLDELARADGDAKTIAELNELIEVQRTAIANLQKSLQQELATTETS